MNDPKVMLLHGTLTAGRDGNLTTGQQQFSGDEVGELVIRALGE